MTVSRPKAKLQKFVHHFINWCLLICCLTTVFRSSATKLSIPSYFPYLRLFIVFFNSYVRVYGFSPSIVELMFLNISNRLLSKLNCQLLPLMSVSLQQVQALTIYTSSSHGQIVQAFPEYRWFSHFKFLQFSCLDTLIRVLFAVLVIFISPPLLFVFRQQHTFRPHPGQWGTRSFLNDPV